MTTKAEQLTNLRALLDVGERVLREQLPFGFGSLGCSTHACLFGWYEQVHGGIGANGVSPHYHPMTLDHFGISDLDARHLFATAWLMNARHNAAIPEAADDPGPEAYAELERRLDYLRTLIAEREPEDAIPAAVRALFCEEREAV